MGIKAVDIVLIPSVEITDLSLEVSKKAKELNKTFLELGRNDFIPHISLALGSVEEENLPIIIEKLNELSKTTSEINLTLSDFGIFARKETEDTLHFKIEISNQLKELHLKAIEIIKPFLVQSNDASIIVEGEITGINESSVKILNNYVSNYSNENYHAHISLGTFDFLEKEEIVSNQFPLSFKATKLALFWVGNRCTCRKEISSIVLN